MNQQEFLARVSARLGRTSPAEAGRPQWQPSAPLPNIGPTDREALVERFVLEAEKLSTKVYQVASEAEVAPMVVAILGAEETGTVVRWQDPTLEGLGLDEVLTNAGHWVTPFRHGTESQPQLELAEKAIAGITGVDMAIAETGTLVLASSRIGEPDAPGRGRTVSLLPPIHIAVVRKEQIVYSTLSLFRRLAAAGPLPSQVAFASGPSRSADIENDLSIGVHGPKEVHVILV
ncbi:MAG: LutC/YkgG family protein [Bacillota bacterium]